MSLGCQQLKCLPCKCTDYFVKVAFSSHHTSILLVSAKFMLICIMCYYFVHVHVVYMLCIQGSGAGPGDLATT